MPIYIPVPIYIPAGGEQQGVETTQWYGQCSRPDILVPRSNAFTTTPSCPRSHDFVGEY